MQFIHQRNQIHGTPDVVIIGLRLTLGLSCEFHRGLPRAVLYRTTSKRASILCLHARQIHVVVSRAGELRYAD
jgi:hypothetical protein